MTRAVHEPLISFARAPDGSIASIEEVPSGLACNCTCLACKGPVVARKGQVRRWSFAHSSNEAISCHWAAETALHFAMKEIIAEEGKIFLPQFEVTVEGVTKYGETVRRTMSNQAQTAILDSVSLEYSVHPIRPDVVATIGDRRLFIEVIVTHGVDAAKLNHIKGLGASALSIDLRRHDRSVDRPMLRRLLLNAAAEKTWVFYRRQAEMEAQLQEEVQRIVERMEREKESRIADGFQPTATNINAPVTKIVFSDQPLADGTVMCFTFGPGREAYIKREPLGALTLEYTRKEDVDAAYLQQSGASGNDETCLWHLTDRVLLKLIPYLNSRSTATTNRTRREYREHRYSA